jgi:hypothetical protein
VAARFLPRAALLVAAATLGIASCGGDTVIFGGGDGGNSDSTVTFKGNLDQVSPPLSRDIVVFVYDTDDSVLSGDRCPCPAPRSCVGGTSEKAACYADADCGGGSCDLPTAGKAAVIPAGSSDFSVSGLESGSFSVVFLLDNAGTGADGEINAGDPIAILDDVDCQLDDVHQNLTVTLKDIDVAFSSSPTSDCQDGNSPAVGRARANVVTLSTTTNSDN